MNVETALETSAILSTCVDAFLSNKNHFTSSDPHPGISSHIF